MSYTLALGPFTTTWRNPQRLVLTVESDTVTDATYRTGYNERGCAERLPRLTLEQAFFLVSRICGMCSHAHTLAFCQSLEQLLGLDVPEQAAVVRALVAELERIISHLETPRTIFDVLGLAHQSREVQEIQAQARQMLVLVSGARMLPNLCVPGGISRTVESQQRSDALVVCAKINRRLAHLLDQITGNSALSARMVDVGTLEQQAAEQFGLRGPMARASGIEADTRLDEPYAAYAQLGVRRIVEAGGDVYARLMVLLLEAFESVKLAEQALQTMPDGNWQGSLPKEIPEGTASAAVEGPRGRIAYTVEGDGRRIGRVTIDTPRQIDRLLARALFTGALLDNVVLIALSTDTCLACAEC